MLHLLVGIPCLRRAVRGEGFEDIGRETFGHRGVLFEGLEDLVAGNGPGPGAEIGAALKSGGLGGNDEKRLLHDVIHEAEIADQREHKAPQRRQMLDEEALDQGGLFGARGVGWHQ